MFFPYSLNPYFLSNRIIDSMAMLNKSEVIKMKSSLTRKDIKCSDSNDLYRLKHFIELELQTRSLNR